MLPVKCSTTACVGGIKTSKTANQMFNDTSHTLSVFWLRISSYAINFTSKFWAYLILLYQAYSSPFRWALLYQLLLHCWAVENISFSLFDQVCNGQPDRQRLRREHQPARGRRPCRGIRTSGRRPLWTRRPLPRGHFSQAFAGHEEQEEHGWPGRLPVDVQLGPWEQAQGKLVHQVIGKSVGNLQTLLDRIYDCLEIFLEYDSTVVNYDRRVFKRWPLM